MAKININGMQFYAYHGCFKEENIVGTHFKVNCQITCDCSKAAQSDQLEETINYQSVYSLIAKQMQQPSALLEHVAYRIITEIKRVFGNIEQVEIEIHKLNPPLGGHIESVSVQLSSNEL